MTGLKKVLLTRVIRRPDNIPVIVPFITRISDSPGSQNRRTLWTTEMVCQSTTGYDSVYVIQHTPSSPNNVFLVYINGLLQRRGTDYTISGRNLTFTEPVTIDSNIIAFYNYTTE